MRRSVHGRQNDQLELFHPPRRSPTWRKLPAELRDRTVELLAQMLRHDLARHGRGNAAREMGDE